MGVHLFIRELEEVTRTYVQASAPEVRMALQRVLPLAKSSGQLTGPEPEASYRLLAECLLRLRGTACAQLRLECLFECGRFLGAIGLSRVALGIAQNGLELAERTSSILFLRRFLTVKANILGEIGEYSQAVETHSRALGIAVESGDAYSQHVSWTNLSAVLLNCGLHQESIAAASRALGLIDYSQPTARDCEARCKANISLCLFRLGNRSRALFTASDAIRESDEPTSVTAAISRLVREMNLISAMVDLKMLDDAAKHVSYMQVLNDRYPSDRARTITDICDGLVKSFGESPDDGILILEDVTNHLRMEGGPLYCDSAAALARAYQESGRPEDALEQVQFLLSYLASSRYEEALATFSGIHHNHADQYLLANSNFRELILQEASLRAKISEREVMRTRLEMLERMAVTADIREDISGEHGYRVGRLSALLAREIGWDRDACSSLDIAARLHDIGKIGIPEKILFDEKTLREAEKHFIAAHTKVGAEILARSEIPQVAIAEEIARCHHEWWDGNGYPRQLKGVSIPKSARIVALADVFDAMTHGRPYAKAVSVDAALDQIALLRGKQFDPELTDHFLGLVRRLAAMEKDLDAYLGKAARNSPFLKARARIKEILAQERESTDEVSPRASDTTLH